MKIRNPKSRFHLNIKRSDNVLDVGGGHNPHPRANTVVDKYTESNYHRSGDIKVRKNQQFINADGEKLPFKDKEFDYVICCHVLEHVENPTQFLSEIFRVGKRGYIETPSLLGEHLFSRESHKWILHEHNNIVYLVDKKKINFNCGYDMGELIQRYLPTQSIGFKIVERTHPNLMSVRIEWENDFAFEVEPTNADVLQYFTGKWKTEWGDNFFPKRSLGQELKETLLALWDIVKSVFKSKVLKKEL
jgi:SAM-dependent methyltransferase